MRKLIQKKLEEIENLEVSTEVPDDILEEEKTYFSFTLTKTYQDSDFNKNYSYSVSLVGYVKRLENATENTLLIIDNVSEEIQKKLKEINIKTSFQDVSIENGIRKMRCTGNCVYNEINKIIL